MRSKVVLTCCLAGLLALGSLVPSSTFLLAQSEQTKDAPAAETSLDLHERQDAVAQKYKRFERLLLQMAEYMRKTDPEQADLLVRGIGQSKSDRISTEMSQITALLEEKRFGDAMDREDKVITSLQSLLDLLQSGDRRSELQAEQERIQQILKDLQITLGKAKDARASNERGDEIQRAIERQEIAEASGRNLVDKIDEQDEERRAKAAEEGAEGEGQTGENQPGEGKESGKGEQGEGEESGEEEKKPGEGETQVGEGKPGDSQSGEQKPGEQTEGKPKEGESQEGDSKAGQEGKEGEPKEGDSKSGQSGESQSGKPQEGESQEGQSQQGQSQQQQQGQQPKGESQSGQQPAGEQSDQQQNDGNQTAGRDEIAESVEKMERAIEELKKKNRGNASREQSEAIAKLEEAKAKLEEILRQLREEERELLLAALEARFQKMLAMQLMVYTGTINLDKTPSADWTSRHHARSRELAQTEDEIALEAVKALDLLKAEGSSIAFPEAIEQMRSDMLTVARRLEQSQAGELTQVIEEDLIEALQEIIESLQKEMEKSEEEQQQQQQQQQQQSPPPLVDKLAELKMLRSLQLRINRRTRVLAREFRGEAAESPEVVDQLQELSRRQSRIQKTTYDLATGRNQ